jgi:hypothetical protein
LSLSVDAAQLRKVLRDAPSDFFAKGWWGMLVRAAIVLAVAGGAGLIPCAAARGQASFGPIQPFAGAPTPVYVAAPYAAATMLAPLPPAPIFSAAPPAIQVPAVTVPPSLMSVPTTGAIPYQPITAPTGGCGCSPYYRPPLPAASHRPTSTLHWAHGMGQPAVYVSAQRTLHSARYVGP